MMERTAAAAAAMDRQQQRRHDPTIGQPSSQENGGPRKLVSSGRLSAPLFGAEHHQQGQHHQHQHQAAPESLLLDLERQLDELDSSGSQMMSEEDQRRYREMLAQLSRMKHEQQSAVGNKSTAAAGRLPPSMVAAAQQLERQSKSLAALSLDPGSSGGRALPMATAVTSKSTSNLLPTAKWVAQSDPRNSEAARELVHEIQEVVVRKKQPPAVPSKPTIRECQRPLAASPFDSSGAKKRVQFSIQQNNENFLAGDPTTNGGNHHQQMTTDDDDERMAEEEEEEEPRAQIVGANEVYVNDPRQRRLQELQAASQKVLKPVMDSSAMGFREKMRMFAEKLGEREHHPNNKALNEHKNSSAERQIQQH